MLPRDSADLELMRASALLELDPAAAAHQASAILETFPDLEEASLLLAAACSRLGNPATATGILEGLIRAHPASAPLQLELGRIHAAAAQHADAQLALRRAVALDDRLDGAWRALAAQCFATGDVAGGDVAYARYTQLQTLAPELKDAAAALNDSRLEAAEALLNERLRQMPGDVVALRMQANVASERGDDRAAEQILNQCLALAPGDAAARFDLASELSAQQRHAEVLPLAERLLACEPRNTSYMCLKAQALRLFGRHAEAIALMQQAMAVDPDNATTSLLYGNVLRETGEQAAAIAAYRQALALKPGMAEAYWSLANLKTVRFSVADREAMLLQLTRSRPVGLRRTNLEFALGKAFEDAGLYEQSFGHYAHGNALRRSTVFYDADAMSGDFQRSKALYTAKFFADRAGWGSERNDPIFIVGLPRSGSTLLEQILASHSQIEGTRELPDIPRLVRETMLQANPDGAPISNFPEPIAKLSRADVEAFAARYLQQTAGYRPLGKPRFVDKMLGNFLHIGLLHLMFPRATIVDARRHPLACSFSCFKQLFARGLAYTYDQQELGRYYRDYAALMDHMDAVLPGRVHRVHYEQLVADPEVVVRRLLNHCRLSFEDGCLRFYETRRVVNTISSEQVRRPITSDSVDQWRHFEPWLGPLAAELGDLVGCYPSFPKVS